MSSIKLLTVFLAVCCAYAGGIVGVPPAEATSLWQGETVEDSSLFVDFQGPKKEINDIILILVEESAKATTVADTDVQVEDTVSGKISNWFSVENAADILKFLTFQSPDVTAHQNTASSLPKWGFEVTNELDGEGETIRNNMVVATLAARVIEIRPNGNLVLEGRRHISINQETNIMTVTGIARPKDVTPNNTIRSSLMADINVTIGGKGIIAGVNRRGLLSLLLGFLR